MPSATPRPAWPREASSRSTRIPAAFSSTPQRPWMRPAISSSPGTATSRTAANTASMPSVQRQRRGPGKPVPGQHVHHGQPVSSAVAMDSAGDFVIAFYGYGAGGVDYGSTPSATTRAAWPKDRSFWSTVPRKADDRPLGGDGCGRRLRRRLGVHLGHLCPATDSSSVRPWGAIFASIALRPAIRSSRRRPWTRRATSLSRGVAPARTAANTASTPSDSPCSSPAPSAASSG